MSDPGGGSRSAYVFFCMWSMTDNLILAVWADSEAVTEDFETEVGQSGAER